MDEEKREIRVGEKIKELREKKGLSLKDLSDLTGFSTALLSQMEAVLAASIFHYGIFTLHEAKSYLKERGIPVRM